MKPLGNGLTITSPFPSEGVKQISPFILLDHLGPFTIVQGQNVDLPDHPHRGFEPVSILFEGSVEHKDSAGHHGFIKGGDIQWMTAGSGIVHSEGIPKDMAKNGGQFHAVQFWVNLPKKFKMTEPKYQNISKENIPVKSSDGVQLRIIAGELDGTKGAASTFSPMMVVHGIMQAQKSTLVSMRNSFNCGLYVTLGQLKINGEKIDARKMVWFNNDGDAINVTAETKSEFLLLAGEPIAEPLVQYGPFVMNTQEEIARAMNDYEEGKMGAINF